MGGTKQAKGGKGREGGKGAVKKTGRAEALRVKKLIVAREKRKGIERPQKGPMGAGVEPPRKSMRLE